MNIVRDDWTPLFEHLKQRLSPLGRKQLLFQVIGDLQDLTVFNFGAQGISRPQEWKQLSPKYAAEFHGGDTTPTLVLDEQKHNLRNPGLPHLKDSFVHSITEKQATLTNTSPYADNHQLGLGIPKRPYYPVDDAGNLTPLAYARMLEIVNGHFQASQH